MAFDLEIRDRLADYLAGTSTLAGFKSWFFPATWDKDTDLSIGIKFAFAENPSGQPPTARTRRELLRLMNNVRGTWHIW